MRSLSLAVSTRYRQVSHASNQPTTQRAVSTNICAPVLESYSHLIRVATCVTYLNIDSRFAPFIRAFVVPLCISFNAVDFLIKFAKLCIQSGSISRALCPCARLHSKLFHSCEDISEFLCLHLQRSGPWRCSRSHYVQPVLDLLPG